MKKLLFALAAVLFSAMVIATPALAAAERVPLKINEPGIRGEGYVVFNGGTGTISVQVVLGGALPNTNYTVMSRSSLATMWFINPLGTMTTDSHGYGKFLSSMPYHGPQTYPMQVGVFSPTDIANRNFLIVTPSYITPFEYIHVN